MATLFLFSMGIVPFGVLLIFIGILGMLSNRKDNKSKIFKEMQKLTLIGLTMVCIGFGICGMIFATGNFR